MGVGVLLSDGDINVSDSWFVGGDWLDWSCDSMLEGWGWLSPRLGWSKRNLFTWPGLVW